MKPYLIKNRFIPLFPVPLQHSLFSFVHHTVNFNIPFDNPTARITSRIDVLDNHVFLFGVRKWVLQYPGHSINTSGLSTTVSQLLSLHLDITHLYSEYSTPVKFGTKEPKLVLTFQDGTNISSSGNIDLQGLTIQCPRSDAKQFESIPFDISMEFVETITTLSTHVFSVNATTLSTTGVYSEFTESFFDSMMVSISVGPGEYL